MALSPGTGAVRAWIGRSAIAAAIAGLAVFALQLGGPAGAAVALAGSRAVTAGVDGSYRPRLPERLSETGLYLADGRVDPRNRPFSPQYPLWTDGADKSRWVRLPRGARIDVSDPDAWRFPAGTTFWKEFAYGGRRVETRMIRVDGQGRVAFATYVWNDEQTEAILAPDHGVPAAFAFAPGRWHAVPGRADCVACHGNATSVILGFGALQLSDDRDPLAPHAGPLPAGALTLRTLVGEDRLRPRRPAWAADPPRVLAEDPVARAALGYLSGNCGSCHHSRGPLARLGFSLHHELAAHAGPPAPSAMSAVGAPARFVPTHVDPDSALVIAPGSPERSVLVHRMASRRTATQMPPLGTALVDSVALELVERWVSGLPVSGANPAARTAAAPSHPTHAPSPARTPMASAAGPPARSH